MVGAMLLQSCKAWSGRHGAYLKEALKQGWRCAESWLWMRVSLLNIPRYIFIVRRLSILSKLDANNPYRIWAELYFLILNYLIILDTWPIWPSWRPRRSRFTSSSYLSYRPILFTAHLLVWPSYGDNKNVESIGLPSVVMWGDRGEGWCCCLSKVWNGGDSWNPSGDVVCHARIC
jgi:hypothetical protein